VRSFEAGVPLLASVPADVARALADADVGRGLEGLHVAQLPGLLEQLALRARVQSVKASSALEGVVVADDLRADRIIAGAASRLRGRSEQELAGYREALDYVWQDDWRPLNVGLVLHLHRLLYSHTATPGGAFKSEDNLVVDRSPDGRQTVRFHPVSARLTPGATEELVAGTTTSGAWTGTTRCSSSDWPCWTCSSSTPFEDGNGRVARVLTNALLAEVGYGVARYVSLEQLIAESADDYYATLLASTHGWHQSAHDPWPWLRYVVGLLGRGVCAVRPARRLSGHWWWQAGTGQALRAGPGPQRFRIADVRLALPGISDGTIRNALDDLRDEGAWMSTGRVVARAGRDASSPSPRPRRTSQRVRGQTPRASKQGVSVWTAHVER
jgi:Fic family protein